MADNIIPLPTEYRRPRVIDGREIAAMPEPSDEMVWELCPYLRQSGGCSACPRTEVDEDHGEVKRGCRGLAEEACRVVMAMQKRESTTEQTRAE